LVSFFLGNKRFNLFLIQFRKALMTTSLALMMEKFFIELGGFAIGPLACCQVRLQFKWVVAE
jgi:polyferredoxin